MTEMINERAPGIAAKFQYLEGRVKVLDKKVAKLNATTQRVLKGDKRSLAELNAAVAKAEKQFAKQKRELAYEQARLRKALAK